MVITARKLAEAFRTPVIVLSDAAWRRASADSASGAEGGVARAADRPVAVEEGVPPYDWDEETGLSPRPIPGQRGGEYVLTGLAHTNMSKVAYDPSANMKGNEMRSRKLAALRSTLKPPKVHGDEEGDLIVVGWGSTLGAITEAVDRARAEGPQGVVGAYSFPVAAGAGLRKIFERFDKVMTVELNYSDPPEGLMMEHQPGRPAQLALLLRGRTRRDIDYWSISQGQPLRPGQIYGR
jgi:2-oxoglutarate ferredoxin oxidoreductase subunit alpha